MNERFRADIKNFIFKYLEYLYTFEETQILESVLNTKDHQSWTTEVLLMIAEDEYIDIKNNTGKNILSISDILDRIKILNRDEKIDKILKNNLI